MNHSEVQVLRLFIHHYILDSLRKSGKLYRESDTSHLIKKVSLH